MRVLRFGNTWPASPPHVHLLPLQDWAFDKWRDSTSAVGRLEGELLCKAAELEESELMHQGQAHGFDARLRAMAARGEEDREKEVLLRESSAAEAALAASKKEATLRRQMQE